ncbi:MAG: hypothetical protein IPP35_00190 [Elusimicrobia bacterium]|nr:hypothetical protein [Elusimicrobiota bacterium]
MLTESAIKLLVGIGLLIVSVAYLYRPVLVLRANAWARTLLFNDAHLLHYRRRWGLLAFLASVLFLYSGFLNLSKLKNAAPTVDLTEGYRDFFEYRFDEAAAIAKEVLKRDSGNPHALFLFQQASRAAKRASPKP